MNSLHSDEHQAQASSYKQDTQNTEMLISEKDNVNRPFLEKNKKTQFSQEKLQTKQFFAMTQQEWKFIQESKQGIQNHQDKSYIQNVFCKQLQINNLSGLNQIIPTNLHHRKQTQSKAFQRNSNFQHSESIEIVSQGFQENLINEKQTQSNKIQEKNRLEIQVHNYITRYNNLEENFKNTKIKLRQSEQQHQRYILQVKSQKASKDQEIISLKNEIQQYVSEQSNFKEQIKSLKNRLSIEYQKTKQYEINQNQFSHLNQQLKSKLQSQNIKVRQYEEKATTKDQVLLAELKQKNQQIQSYQSQLQERSSQIKELIKQNKYSQRFKEFKLKQQSELSNLTNTIKKIMQVNFNKLSDQLKEFKQEISKNLRQFYQEINQKYKNSQKNLVQISYNYQQEINRLNKTCEDTFKGLQQIIRVQTQRSQSLEQNLAQLEEESCDLVNFYQSKQDQFQKQICRLQMDKIELEIKHKQQKEQMLMKMCQYAKKINNLQTQLQKNHIIQMQQNQRKQMVLNWASDQLQHEVIQFDNYKKSTKIQIKNLQKSVQYLKSKLKKSLDSAIQRQDNIVNKVCQFYSNLEKVSNQCFVYRDKNKNMLTNQLNQIFLINQKVYQGDLILKKSQIQQKTKQLNTIEMNFQNFKKQTQSELYNLYNKKWQLQFSLEQTQKAKQYKLQIEKQYAVKEETLNNIIYKLKHIQKSFNLKDVIKCFIEIDTNRIFYELVSILDSISQHYHKIQNKCQELQKQLNQKKSKQIIFDKQRIESYAKIVGLQTQIANQKTILNYEKNRHITLSTILLQLEQDLQAKQEIIGQLKSESNRLSNQHKRMIQAKKDEQIQKGEVNRLKNRIDQLVQQNKRNLQTYKLMQLTCQKNSEQEIIMKNEVQNKNKTTTEALQKALQQQKSLAQEYKQRLKKLQNKLKQSSLMAVTEKQFKDIQQKLNQYKKQIKSKQFELRDLANQLTAKNQQLEIAIFSLKKYQQQQKLQKQKDKHPKMWSPVSNQNSENINIRETIKSPLRFQIKDNTKRSIILENDLPQFFKDSDIFIRNEDEQFLKNAIQKFTGKSLLSAQIKFKMQLSKPDYLNEAKTVLALINTANLAWIFKKEGQIFGALSFNKEIKQQQSALLFNIAKKKQIYPANMKSNWVPIKSDSFYLFFGVQEAKYIWKSRIMSISDSKTVKYFDQKTPLIDNFVNKQKIEVQQFEIFFLNIKK